MPASSQVPISYISRWKANASQSAPSSSTTVSTSLSSDVAPSKYNTSCNACREARVKCPGGIPCQKCAASSHPSSCTYSVSRRRGKRKASHGPHPELGSRVDPPIQADPLDITNFDSIVMHEWPGSHEIPWPESDGPVNSAGDCLLGQPNTIGGLGGLTDTSTPFTDPFDAITPPNPAPSSGAKDTGACPESCYASVHSAANKLISALNERGAAGLGKSMQVLDQASADATKYLECPLCDTGCTRLINLALLHQRQLNILCDICSNPSLYLGEDSAPVTLGKYQPSRADDVVLKRVMLLGVARVVRASVDEFRGRARGFEERHVAGTLELQEAGKLNLQWILGIAANLTRRLDTVRAILEKEDWGAQVESSRN